MMGNQNVFSIVFAAMVALLSCSTVSSLSILPRVTRTSDSIIIDFADQENPDSAHQGRNDYREIANPGFIPVPEAFNPYAMMYQQQPKFPNNGWSYFYGFPSLINPAAAPSQRQFDGDEEEFEKEFMSEIQVEKQATRAANQCGRGPTTFPTARSSIGGRINAGNTAAAKKGAWPFMVVLKKTPGAVGDFFCVGSLISDSRVLLAAQCLEKMSVYDISTVTVLIGMHKPDQTDVQMTRRISKIIIHSGFNAVNYANDIAVIILDTPVVLSKTVSTVCLPPASTNPDQYADQPAVILGWGSDSPQGLSPLEQGLVAMDTFANCVADTTFGQYVTGNTTCITSAGGNRFTCIEDIGGPVVINTAPATVGTPAVYTIVGINSYTKDCATGGLKTRVAAYRDWIDKAN